MECKIYCDNKRLEHLLGKNAPNRTAVRITIIGEGRYDQDFTADAKIFVTNYDDSVLYSKIGKLFDELESEKQANKLLKAQIKRLQHSSEKASSVQDAIAGSPLASNKLIPTKT